MLWSKQRYRQKAVYDVLRPWVANSQSIVLAEDIGCFEASQVQQH